MNIPVLKAFERRRVRVAFALVLGVSGVVGVSASVPAWAQLGPPVGSAPGRPSRTPTTPPKAVEPPPEAIPGAKAREPAVPASRPAGDMQPTDALFDAINRGDITGARDALNRGADLNGVNILGMTPMELSIDLGRNDISFLLLSMRGEDPGRGSRLVGQNGPQPEATGKTALTGGPGKAKGVQGKTAKAGTPHAPTVATPKLFANDGGTPLPSAGFLGFDSRPARN